MKNFIQEGSTLTIPAPAAVLSGDVVIAGEIIGVASGDAVTGAPVDVAVTGVFALPKVGANTFALGAVVYYANASGLATSTGSGNTRIGVAVAAAGTGVPTVAVRLPG